MSLLTIVQEFCRRTGLSVPTAVVSSTNTQIIQIYALLNELVEELTLAEGYYWKALNKEATFTTVSGRDQGELATLAPDGYLAAIGGTFWNRSQDLPLIGPLSPGEWQARLAMSTSGNMYAYRFQEGSLMFDPAVVTTGETIAFEYNSSYAIRNGATYKASFTSDSDVFLLPEQLLTLGLRWKWKEEKGLDFTTAFATWRKVVDGLKSSDGTKAVLRLAGGSRRGEPGIFVPYGSYNP